MPPRPATRKRKKTRWVRRKTRRRRTSVPNWCGAGATHGRVALFNGGLFIILQSFFLISSILCQLTPRAVGRLVFNRCAATYPKEKKRTVNPKGSKILG